MARYAVKRFRAMRRPRRRFGGIRSGRRISRYSRGSMSYRLHRAFVAPTLLSRLPTRPEVKRVGWSDPSTTCTFPNPYNANFTQFPAQFATGQTWPLFFDAAALAAAVPGGRYGTPVVQGPPSFPGFLQGTTDLERVGARVNMLSTRLRVHVSRIQPNPPGENAYGTAPARFWVALVKRKDGTIDPTANTVGNMLDWYQVAAPGTSPVAQWSMVQLPFSPNQYDVLWKKECQIDVRNGGTQGVGSPDAVEFTPIDLDLLIKWGARGTEATFPVAYDSEGASSDVDYPIFVEGNYQATQLVIFGNMDLGLSIANSTWNGVQTNAAVTCEHYFVDP